MAAARLSLHPAKPVQNMHPSSIYLFMAKSNKTYEVAAILGSVYIVTEEPEACRKVRLQNLLFGPAH